MYNRLNSIPACDRRIDRRTIARRTDRRTSCDGIKFAIFDEYLVDHCWMHAHAWSPFGVGAINDVHSWMLRPCMSGQIIVYDASHRSYFEENCPKTILPPCWQTPQDIATKSGEIQVRDRTPLRCKFSRRSLRDICQRAKTYFLYSGLPWWATVPSHGIHF